MLAWCVAGCTRKHPKILSTCADNGLPIADNAQTYRMPRPCACEDILVARDEHCVSSCATIDDRIRGALTPFTKPHRGTITFNGMGSGRSVKRMDLAVGRGKEGNVMAFIVWLSWHSWPDFGTLAQGPSIGMACAPDQRDTKGHKQRNAAGCDGMQREGWYDLYNTSVLTGC